MKSPRNEVRELDTSGRFSVGRGKIGEQYDFDEDSDGKITLTLVAVIPKPELWLYNNPEAKQALLSGISDSAAGRTRDGGDFAQYLDDKDEE